jgi:uncharacterized SAM-binding protein YcdF (DUF218 family)
MSLDDSARALFVRDDPQPADLALVFGHGDAYLSRCRARQAVSLYRQRLVPRLLFSGGGHATTDGTPEGDLMASEALALGVPQEAILVETESRNTYENLRNTLVLLQDKNLLAAAGVVLLVSCPWHMRRVLLLARHVLPPSLHLLCCPHQEFCTEETWASSPACRRLVENELFLLAGLTGRRGTC